MRERPIKRSTPLPYYSRGYLMSRVEHAFWNMLVTILEGKYCVAPKVRLADVINCDEDSWQRGHGRWIGPRHCDFVLFEPKTARIRLVIELDDPSHKTARRSRSDDFLQRALETASVPLLRIPVDDGMTKKALFPRIKEVLDDGFSDPTANWILP